jgi:protein required for attachment to host cells
MAIKTLTLVKEFNHPQSRQKGTELASDRSGHFNGDTSGASHGAFNEATTPKSYERERFAMELAETLNKGRNAHEYNKLIIVSSPRFHGLLNKQINPQVGKMVGRHLEKDFTSLPPRELLKKLH